jgi:hypothetical protein
MAVANSIAYFAMATITAVKSFIVQAPGAEPRKLFQSLLLPFHIKLECLTMPFAMC